MDEAGVVHQFDLRDDRSLELHFGEPPDLNEGWFEAFFELVDDIEVLRCRQTSSGDWKDLICPRLI